MGIYKLGAIELRFAGLIWERAPIGSGELVKLCAAELGWKKSTTYTVLRKLCDKGFFENRNGMVTVLATRADYEADQSRQVVQEEYHGSLPYFISAFAGRDGLGDADLEELERLIERYRKGGRNEDL